MDDVLDVFNAVKETGKDFLKRWEFLDSLGFEITVYDRTEINVSEFFDDSKIYLFNESVTGKYDVIAQIDKDKFLHITEEQKEELKTFKG